MSPSPAHIGLPPDFLAEVEARMGSHRARPLVGRVGAIGDYTLALLDETDAERRRVWLEEVRSRTEHLLARLRELAGEDAPPVPESCARCPWLTFFLPKGAEGHWCGRMLTEGVSEEGARVLKEGAPPVHCPRR